MSLPCHEWPHWRPRPSASPLLGLVWRLEQLWLQVPQADGPNKLLPSQHFLLLGPDTSNIKSVERTSWGVGGAKNESSPEQQTNRSHPRSAHCRKKKQERKKKRNHCRDLKEQIITNHLMFWHRPCPPRAGGGYSQFCRGVQCPWSWRILWAGMTLAWDTLRCQPL